MYEPARLCFILDNFDVLEKWKGMIDRMEPWMGRTAAVVDLGMLKNNLAEIRKKLKPGVELMAVLKGDGYRHGAEGLYPTLKACGVTNYAVALWSEGVALREHGATEPILVLGDTRDYDLDEAVRYNLDFPVFSVEYAKTVAEAAKRQGRKQNIQIKLDTGMSRIGFPDNDETLEAIKEISQMESLNMTGIFTHFARADEYDHKSAGKQLDRFLRMTEKLKEMGITFPKYHVANSPAILLMPDSQLDMVRAGDILYGLNPIDEEGFKKGDFELVHVCGYGEGGSDRNGGWLWRHIRDEASDEDRNPAGWICGWIPERSVEPRKGADPWTGSTDHRKSLYGSVYGRCDRYPGCTEKRSGDATWRRPFHPVDGRSASDKCR